MSPGLLTPRVQEVLGFLRANLTNADIANRLGISVETVKQHVSEILSKLSVATREEAAAWQPELERLSNQPPWARLFALLAMRLLGAIIVAAALAGVGVLLWFQLRSGGPTETVEVTVRPVASTAAGTSGSPVASLAPGDPAVYATALDRVQQWLHAWLAGDTAAQNAMLEPESQQLLPTLQYSQPLSGEISGYQPAQYVSDNEFTLSVDLQLHLPAANESAWGEGVNSRFITFKRADANSPFLMKFATGP